VALYRITTARHDPGCSTAGNGLLISFQCLFLRRNATLVTLSLQSPTLQIESVRSSVQQALTAPKKFDPVTASLPAGAFADTLTDSEPALLNTVITPPPPPAPLAETGWATPPMLPPRPRSGRPGFVAE